MADSDAASETYRLLLRELLGYPLWYPDLDENLSQQYREKGVQIGDVGIITRAGQFDFKFNVHDGSYASYGFQPWVSQDTSSNSNMRPAPTIMKRGSVTKMEHKVDILVPASASIGGGVEFTCSADESAILVLPDGASRTNLKQPEKFLGFLTEAVALQWLEIAGSSSLTLVTGCVKSRSWGVAAVSNPSRQASVSLNFSATMVGGQFTGSYSWQSSSGGHQRDGPKSPSNIDNQCVFLRGFKLSRKKLAAPGKRKLRIADVGGSKLPDSGEVKRQRNMPFGSGHVPSGITYEASQWSQDAPVEADELESSSDDEVFVEELADMSEHYHPSEVINEYLLKQFPDARVAVTHDDDWCALIEEADEKIPDDDELLRRVHEKYTPVLESGFARLMPREIPDVHSQDSVLDPISHNTGPSPSHGSPVVPRPFEFPSYHSQRQPYGSQQQGHDTVYNVITSSDQQFYEAQQLSYDTASSVSTSPTPHQSIVPKIPVLHWEGRPYGVDLTGQVRILPTPGQPFPMSIGTGTFTDVFKGEYGKVTASGVVDVAVKIFRRSTNDDPQRTADINRRLIRESNVWVRLNHRNILPYLGHCSDLGPAVALISPFCAAGTIMKYNYFNPSADKLQLVKDAANGLLYLHSENIIHCNLQCNNVFVDDQGRAVLANFSRAKVIGEVGYSDPVLAGSAAYMGPELFPLNDVNVDDRFSKNSDVYAFGMLCYEVFTNEPPFACYDARMEWQIVPLIQQGKRPKCTTQVQRQIPMDMWRLMEACWVTAPENRPSAELIMQRIQ